MFLSEEAKAIGTQIQKHNIPIRDALWHAFEQAICNAVDEPDYVTRLVHEIDSRLSALTMLPVTFVCQKKIHAKPKVVYGPNNDSCELGDLLVVVKYLLPTQVYEVKSIIYQVKLAAGKTHSCGIDPIQLELLKNWPEFEFGLTPKLTGQKYRITPTTLEFGSYMLMLRKPTQGGYLNKQDYGYSPHAHRVGDCQHPVNLDVLSKDYVLRSSTYFFNHIAFLAGEHHHNASVATFMAALYRLLGWDPDPPREFHGYYDERQEDGFAAIEIRVIPREHSNKHR